MPVPIIVWGIAAVVTAYAGSKAAESHVEKKNDEYGDLYRDFNRKLSSEISLLRSSSSKLETAVKDSLSEATAFKEQYGSQKSSGDTISELPANLKDKLEAFAIHIDDCLSMAESLDVISDLNKNLEEFKRRQKTAAGAGAHGHPYVAATALAADSLISVWGAGNKIKTLKARAVVIENEAHSKAREATIVLSEHSECDEFLKAAIAGYIEKNDVATALHINEKRLEPLRKLKV